MDTDLSGAPGKDPKFWDGFLEAVRAQGVKAPYDRWYMIRGEQYLKAYPDTPLSMHRPDEVNAYLTEIGRKGSLKDWQFRERAESFQYSQSNRPAQRATTTLQNKASRASTTWLEPHHATIARDAPLARPSGPQDRQEEADPGRGPVRGMHAEVLYALIAEIRRRAYSIRTEQGYEHWA